MKEIVNKVINILYDNQYGYIDPAEHIYDGMINIKRHIDEKELERFIPDFILALSSSANIDVDGTLNKCILLLTKALEQRTTATISKPFRTLQATSDSRKRCVKSQN
jgi:hypothetical protein